MTKERINEIIGLLFLTFSIFLFVSFITYHPDDIPFFSSRIAVDLHNSAGLIGAYAAFGVFFVLGYCGYAIPCVFMFWAICMFVQKVPEKLIPKVIGFFVMQLSLSCLVALLNPMETKMTAAGIVGYVTSQVLFGYLGFAGTFIYSVFCLLISFLLATEFLLYELIVFICGKIGALFVFIKNTFVLAHQDMREGKEITPVREKKEKNKRKKKPAKEEDEDTDSADFASDPLPQVELKIKTYEDHVKKTGDKKIKTEKEKKDVAARSVSQIDPVMSAATPVVQKTMADESIGIPETGDASDMPSATDNNYKFVAVGADSVDMKSFQLPQLDYLQDPVVQVGSNDDLRANSQMIEKRLADFDIQVKVVEVEQGPVITKYEILPAPGIKLSSILNLQDDIALTMKTSSVRIAPVLGKSTVGIEVPNSVTNMVFIKDLLEHASAKVKKYSLPMFLGKNTSGAPLVADLADMPHLLVAGTTGSGKTVCVNAIIIGMMYRLKPSQLRFVMIDPKMVELTVYNGIPHLLAPVVTDPKKAASVLNWVVQEMENRYKLLASVGVRNIRTYNTRERSDSEEDNTPACLPYIVVVIDELADLMLIASDKVEGAIARLAQLSRAVGIHLILATQRPSVDVITGVIKANFPARLSFKVASKVDSRTVLDMMGADKLLGKGDMLFVEPGQAKPVRAQAAFISDNEIKNIVDFVKSQHKTEYLESVQDIVDGKKTQAIMDADDMYDEAVRVVMETGQASVSVLQRRLRLGYARAARIVDMMEANGVVGPYQGSKARDILVDRDTFLEQ